MSKRFQWSRVERPDNAAALGFNVVYTGGSDAGVSLTLNLWHYSLTWFVWPWDTEKWT